MPEIVNSSVVEIIGLGAKIPDAAVIIPHFNDVRRLLRCLSVLLPGLLPTVEVVVIDNGSQDSLAPVRLAWPDLRIVVEQAKGAASARNRGVVETTAPLLFFLDCDCVPAVDWLATALGLTELRRLHPGATNAGSAHCDLVGGTVSVFDETAPPRTGAQVFEAVFAFDNRSYVLSKGFSVTANLLTRRDVFEAVGGFTPGLSEDLDWCHRARAKGYRLIYTPELRVAHPSRGDWTGLSKKWRRLTEESFQVHGTGAPARLSWALKSFALPPSIVVHAMRILRHPGLSMAERGAGLVTLAQLRLTRMVWMLRQAAGGAI